MGDELRLWDGGRPGKGCVTGEGGSESLFGGGWWGGSSETWRSVTWAWKGAQDGEKKNLRF